MAKSKEEQIFIGVGEERIELTGFELEAFEADRKQIRDKYAEHQKQMEMQKSVKVSAYTKLGLTEEEINAIL